MAREFIILECTEAKAEGKPISRYISTRNKKSPESPWAASFDCGLTYALTSDLQLDAGVNIGLTRAEDLNPFLGLSIRF